MPRISPSLLHRAACVNPLLAALLPECRNLDCAQNELRWLEEYAEPFTAQPPLRSRFSSPKLVANKRLHRLVQQRARGIPLQYLLHSQPFGDLEIECRKGVLIPRPETEVYTIAVAKILRSIIQDKMHTEKTLNILDACTGTGCIALLLHSILHPPKTAQNGKQAALSTQTDPEIHIRGLDISCRALQLADDNLRRNVAASLLHSIAFSQVNFVKADVLRQSEALEEGPKHIRTEQHGTTGNPAHRTLDGFIPAHVLISNPPYISPQDYLPGGTTTQSVRRYEPKLALVPPEIAISSHYGEVEQADIFYHKLLLIAEQAGSKLIVFEIGDAFQAARICHMASRILQQKLLIEVWRDDETTHEISQHSTLSQVKGFLKSTSKSNCRVVVVWTQDWIQWRKKLRDK